MQTCRRHGGHVVQTCCLQRPMSRSSKEDNQRYLHHVVECRRHFVIVQPLTPISGLRTASETDPKHHFYIRSSLFSQKSRLIRLRLIQSNYLRQFKAVCHRRSHRACLIKDLDRVPVTTCDRPRHFLICRRESSVFPEFGDTQDIWRHVGNMLATCATKTLCWFHLNHHML